MTIEEAIKLLEIQKPVMGCKEYKKPLMTAYDMAIAALEKQIPKKLDVWADGTEHCPNCEHDNSCLGFKICVNCGQRLDWE